VRGKEDREGEIMAKKFFKRGMKAFKDYYPVGKCAKFAQSGFACPKCGHLEMRVEMVKYDSSWLYDYWTIRCEKCGTKSNHSG